jgi:amino-acid N-acetyltransferase
MAHSAIRVISGNFITVRWASRWRGPATDRRGAQDRRRRDPAHHERGGIVLLSPLGFSPTGEAFNLTMEDVAVSPPSRCAPTS